MYHSLSPPKYTLSLSLLSTLLKYFGVHKGLQITYRKLSLIDLLYHWNPTEANSSHILFPVVLKYLHQQHKQLISLAAWSLAAETNGLTKPVETANSQQLCSCDSLFEDSYGGREHIAQNSTIKRRYFLPSGTQLCSPHQNYTPLHLYV